MTIRLEDPEFHASVADVRQACDAIAEARARASEQVSELLDGGWTGAAAAAFAEAWQDWLVAATAVSADLEALADVLAVVHRDLTEVDAVTTCGFDQLSGRLG